MKAMRFTKTGLVFPFNEQVAKSDAVEIVELDADGKVVEPEEVGPAAATTKATDTATSTTRRRKTTTTKGEGA